MLKMQGILHCTFLSISKLSVIKKNNHLKSRLFKIREEILSSPATYSFGPEVLLE